MIKKLFLEALGASLRGAYVDWKDELRQEDWADLFLLAQKHQVLPMIFEAVYASPAARSADPQMMMFFKRQTMHSVMLQAMKTNEFLALMEHLRGADLTPCVVKGIVCRSLYPNPDHRISGDEDVLIPPQQYERCHEALLSYGMKLSDPDKERETAYEVPYGKPGSPVYIELHKHLFPPENDAYGDFNRFFEGIGARLEQVCINNTLLYTMKPTDHFFYLICHAFKHFLHSGFGLRQVCDIVLYANHYGDQIDWLHVYDMCAKIHAERFTAALLRIGEVYFGFQAQKACYPEIWQALDVDAGPMLDDLLSSGIYGDASMSRKHSSTMTLDAVTADKRGKKQNGNVLRMLFPSAKLLAPRYPYLAKKPWLLPLAWCTRILRYWKEKRTVSDNRAAESLRIGKERIALMREYRIIK
ncbi:MAG: nucleotidyltransferase family protein [Clostridia bacterium]|nr:nucleotidyltransferase family protein [Clostridia bacterium]